MKKIIWGLAALSLLVMTLATSCDNERVERKDDSVISYKTATGKQTSRARETTPSTILSEELNVWAYFNSGDDIDDLFKHYKLTYSSGWTYGTPDVHPFDEGLTHYSVHPEPPVEDDGVGEPEVFELENVDTATGDATFDYVIPSPQVDLIVAIDETTGDSQINATAELTYSHILSQVNFAVAGFENAIITITDIKLGDVANSSTYSFLTGWDTPTGTASYIYTPDGTGATTGVADEIVYFGNSTAVGATLSHSNALMLMPQTFSLGTGAYFTFDYEITNMDGTVVLKSGDDEKVFFGDLGQNWMMGKRYVYVINFDLYIIEYTVVVDLWEDYNDAVNGEVDTDDI